MTRTVVVTGGSRGIGRATVAAFAAAGDRVLALGRDEAALAALRDELGGGVSVRACDVADEGQVAEAFAGAGDVDVLVNNAGVAESAPLGRTSVESWQRHQDVNALGPFLCTRAVIDDMRRRGRGRIVTVASTAGRVGTPYTAAYTASKHAAVGLMRVAASELAGSGATANALCPTFVDTPMTERSVLNIRDRTGRGLEEGRRVLEEAGPLGRLLAPDEVAAAVVWLCSEAARSINGQALVMDGGGLQA